MLYFFSLNKSLLRCVFTYNVCMPVCIERWMDGWIDACIYDMFTLLYFFSLNMSLLRCVFMYNVCMPVCIERWMDGWIDACIYDMYVCVFMSCCTKYTHRCMHAFIWCFLLHYPSLLFCGIKTESVSLRQPGKYRGGPSSRLHRWFVTYYISYYLFSVLCVCAFFLISSWAQ